MKVINPATGAVIGDIPEDDAVSVRSKATTARKAQVRWAATPLPQRIEILTAFRNAIPDQLESLAAILTSEVGKPIRQARNELNGLLPRLDFFLEATARETQEETVFRDPQTGMEERITHEPLGVIANISAWNYPYFVGSNVFFPALLTGNAVLYKPSEFASLTGTRIAEMFWTAGVPRDVFALCLGGGNLGGELLQQRLNGVFFTGSYATGSKILAAANQQMMKVQLELGGKDPIYITDEVDAVAAAEATADGAFYNTGQSCCSVERIYVHERVYEPFLEAFLKTVNGFSIGVPTEESTYIGPLTREAQLAVLADQVREAVERGAKLRCGGKRMSRPGFYFEPTVLTDVNHSMQVMREESFGPIIGIQKVSTDEEAITLMNDTPYGLTAGVYGRSPERSREILSQVNAGSVYWNCCDRVSPRLPWSGRGHSGLGSTLSRYGIQTFLQPKAWHWRKG